MPVDDTSESGLTRAEKRALFERYRALLEKETHLRQEIDRSALNRKLLTEEIRAHLGLGPWNFDGRVLEIRPVGRARTLYLVGFGGTEPEEI